MRRIQRRRTKGWRMPPHAVYVGRPTRWGNEFRPDMLDVHGQPLGRQRALELYRISVERFVSEAPLAEVEAWLAPLRQMDLVCWCPIEEPCHADFLLQLAVQQFGEGRCTCGHGPVQHAWRRGRRARCNVIVNQRGWLDFDACKCRQYDISRLPEPGQRLEFGVHRLSEPEAETAPAWPSLAAVQGRRDAAWKREQRKVAS